MHCNALLATSALSVNSGPPASCAAALAVCRWGSVYGRLRLPASANRHIPAIMDWFLLPIYLLYKLLGPQLSWQINQHPFFGAWNMFAPVAGNVLVYGQLLVAAAGAALAVAACRRRSPAIPKAKTE